MCKNPLRKVLSPFKDNIGSDFTFFQISEVGDIFYQEYVYEVTKNKVWDKHCLDTRYGG